MGKKILCLGCKEEKEQHGKGYCDKCYKSKYWSKFVRKKKLCKRCKRLRFIHSQGYCGGCYNLLFKLEKIKEWNYKKDYGLNLETYRKITSKCVICGFDKVIDLHHLDENRKNNNLSNLIGLCPNHHRMLHNYEYKKEILDQLRELGFKIEFNEDLLKRQAHLAKQERLKKLKGFDDLILDG